MRNLPLRESPLRRILAMVAAWLLKLLVGTGAIIAMSMAFAFQGRTGIRTVLFAMEVLEMPVRPQTWFIAQPLCHETHYPSARGISVGHVYRLPGGKPRAATVLSLGITGDGMEDPIVVNLGNALARTGVVVLFDWSPIMGTEYHLEPDEPENLVAAFLYLERQEYVDPQRVGLGGFCVGASSALIAAADPRIRDRVYRISAFGPYNNAEDVVIQTASRTSVYEGESTPWQPSDSTKRVLANELIMALECDDEAAIFMRRYVGGKPLAPEERDSLSPQGQAVARLLDGVELEEAESLYATLPSSFHTRLAMLSPVHHIGEVRARILVLNDRNDRVVPPAESHRLVESLRERGNVRHTELRAFDHVTLSDRRPFTLLGEAVRLYRHMYEIVRVAS